MKGSHSFGKLFKRNFIPKVSIFILITIFLASIAHTTWADGSPKDLKLSAIEKLTGFQSTREKKYKATQKAISHIQKSLADNLWENAAHLAPDPKGKQVFHEEHKAAKQLEKLANSKKISEAIKSAAIQALDDLVSADMAIAETALSEARAYAGTSKKVDHFIKKSEKNLQKAERLREQGQYARAIKCFEKAWHHARLAIKHAGEAPLPVEPPTVSVTATPTSITLGETSTLSWSSTNADTVVIDNGIGIVSVNGSVSVFPDHTTTYTIIATNSSGGVQSSATVTLVATVEPLPEGSFGKQYEGLVPVDATIEAYDEKRFVVITGFVYGRGMIPLPGVTISLHNHPEYGTARSDATGRFSIPADGGGLFTVVYEKEGYITAHRQVHTPWNDIVVVDDDPVMIQQDTKATQVVFDDNPSTVTVHESTPVTDEFGTRSCTMVFTGDNRAYTTDANGNEIELTTITTRATEFDTPESMPAILPPTSAYTYCADIVADEVEHIRFEKPVVTWVDNFIGFDVGMVVPVGYYDRDRAVWIPADNGVVVRLLDTNADGVVDALDSTGDGQPNDLNSNGSFTDEVTCLDNPDRYQPNATYWRVAISHFTPWDMNWPFGLPQGAISSNAEGKPSTDEQKCPTRDCNNHINSYVSHRSRIFHEDITIAGTNITLHYASKRVKGYHHIITVPASGETVPETLKGIIVRVQIAGRQFEQELPALPNQKTEFVWDGLDYLGQPIIVPIPARISIGFIYDAVYYTAWTDFEQSFALTGDDVTGYAGRSPLTAWKRFTPILMAKGESTIAEGWTLSSHHWLSPMDKSVLHMGDGTIITNKTKIIDTVAGTGTYDYTGGGDGGPAIEAEFGWPTGIAVDSAGNLYISEWASRIRKVNKNGIITTVAGTGTPGYSGDGGPATEAQLYAPQGIAVDAAGNIYIADRGTHHVRKVNTNGIIRTVAGNGTVGYSGDGGPATEAKLCDPYDVAVDALGNIYIADRSNHRVRKVDINGIITTVAGNGTHCYLNEDGEPARETCVPDPMGVAVDTAGNLYIADETNCIRKVDVSGIITTVAGCMFRGYSGDGGPASDAWLYYPASRCSECRRHHLYCGQGQPSRPQGRYQWLHRDHNWKWYTRLQWRRRNRHRSHVV